MLICIVNCQNRAAVKIVWLKELG
jgi:hypothetical protein